MQFKGFKKFENQKGEGGVAVILSLMGFALLVLLVGGGMYGCPQYSVYSSRCDGEAELAKANYSKQVSIQEANAKMESAKLLAMAEVERAKGVAQANKIIGGSLEGNESYLRYLWIQNLHEGGNQVIYVPTEANLPILEANRLIKDKKP